MDERRIRVGVVGAGFGAAVHVPSLKEHPDLEVVALCSGRIERAKETAERLGVPAYFDDYRKMLEQESLDAVTIATPPNLHYPIARAALEAKAHVICEKPFVLNSEEALDLCQRANAAGVVNMVAHEFRFTAPRARMKELIDEGYLGQTQVVHVSLFLGGARGRARPWSWSASREAGGGFLFALGSHYIDAIRCWFGEVSGVFGRVYALQPQRQVPGTEDVRLAEVEDSFTFNFELARGGWGSMVATSSASISSGVRIEAHGIEGVLVSTQRGVNPSPEGKLYGAKAGDRELVEIEVPERLVPHSDPRDDRITSFKALVKEFVEAIQEGRQASPSFYDGLRCQRVLDAVLESDRSRVWTDVPQDPR